MNKENRMGNIEKSQQKFQDDLIKNSETLEQFIEKNYISKWAGEDLYNATVLRTAIVGAMHKFLAKKGLINIEKVSLSPLTDPLCHGVESLSQIYYKGAPYVLTHSMIYSKIIACLNPKVKGVFIDSPNIRLEIEADQKVQRKKYVIDFSQMDIELRRGRSIQIDEYKNSPEKVEKILKQDMDNALDFFEDLIIYTIEEVLNTCPKNIEELGIILEVPQKPFPRFKKDEALARLQSKSLEADLGKETDVPFFWVTGLLRENYDLVYPYILSDGKTKDLSNISSDMIYNYDLCAQSKNIKTGKYGTAYEILSGGIREWLYEPIVKRLIANKVIDKEPIFENGCIKNISQLKGYGPFLMVAAQKDKDGKSLFPDTFGGGIGLERILFALCSSGENNIEKIDDVMFFGKNPDMYPLYLF